MSNADKPAFSVCHQIDGNWVKEPLKDYQGLTKREHFAAKAMQGILTGIYGGGGDNYRRQLMEWRESNGPLATVGEAAAKDALGYADELLKQLEPKQ